MYSIGPFTKHTKQAVGRNATVRAQAPSKTPKQWNQANKRKILIHISLAISFHHPRLSRMKSKSPTETATEE